MSYDDVEIEDMEWNEELQSYTYPCPCGDLFQITKDDLRLGEEIARCPSCSLYITLDRIGRFQMTWAEYGRKMAEEVFFKEVLYGL
ncbi:hypothetical protein LWI28_007798 [Acer negundo]|uniref:Diphthamide biosynthesis protein 3 n=1 Tax=Acer negundo TaxID=4023 RepID=A0AAD5P5M9_ACENE|nr:hypothetical protein LWI28_007798 [Acer negundo]